MTEVATGAQQGIQLTEEALKHVLMLKQQQGNENLCLRVGVRQGGCSGMMFLKSSAIAKAFCIYMV